MLKFAQAFVHILQFWGKHSVNLDANFGFSCAKNRGDRVIKTNKMAKETVTEESQPEVKMDATIQSKEKQGKKSSGLVEQLFSWRAVIYLLLHLTFHAWCIPRSATSMAFVCINSRREELLHTLNTSSSSVVNLDIEAQGQTTEGGNSTAGYDNNPSQSILEAYQNVIKDIAWDSNTKGLVLAGPLMLAFVGPLLFDAIIQRVGTRSVLACTQAVMAALMFSAPSLARASPYLLLVNHIILGLVMNACAPVVATLLPRWTPSKHNLTVVALVYSGPTLGPMLLSMLNGFLCSIPLYNGWPFIFYTAGVLHAIFGLTWFCLVGEYPESHRFISEKETDYIVSKRPTLAHSGPNQKRANRPPYLVLLSSVPVLTFTFVFSGFTWVLLVTLVYVPIYLNTVHGFSAEQTGIAFAVICGIRMLGAYFWTALGNMLTNRKILSLPATRKVCICTGMACAACTCFAVSFFDREYKWVAIAFLMLSLIFQAVSTSHLNSVPIDMAPRYAGTISSLAVSTGLLVSVTGPLIVAALTPTGSYDEWRCVWYILAAFYLANSIVFMVLGQATLQSWASTGPKEGPQSDQLL